MVLRQVKRFSIQSGEMVPAIEKRIARRYRNKTQQGQQLLSRNIVALNPDKYVIRGLEYYSDEVWVVKPSLSPKFRIRNK